MTVEQQVEAMQAAYAPGLLSEVDARAALDAAREALASGLAPVFAVNAAAAWLYAGFAGMAEMTRSSLLVETMNALMAAERAGGPLGTRTAPAVDPGTPLTALEKVKRQRLKERADREARVAKR